MLFDWRAKAGQPFRPTRDLSTLMLRILGEVLFGYPEMDRLGGKDLHKALVTIMTEFTLRYLAPFPYWRFVKNPKLLAARRYLDDAIDKVVAAAEARRRTHPHETNLLQALLGAREAGTLTDQDVHDEVLNFFVAGHETSATAAAWLLASLAANPEAQQKAREEVDEVFRAPAVEAEGLEELPYLRQVIQETMRLYPAAPVSLFTTAADTTLAGHALPKGTAIDIVSYAVHRDPDLWPNVEHFDAARFGNTEASSMVGYQFFPFLGGRHHWIGHRRAMGERELVAAVVRRELELAPLAHPPTMNLRVSLTPTNFQLTLRPRAAHRSSLALLERMSRSKLVAAAGDE
jgi:cytochrome P450